MPLVGCNLGVDSVNLFTTAFNHSIETDIVLKRIGTDDVVIVGISNANRNSACLINTACNRFESYGDFDVFGDNWLKDSEWKTIVSAIRTRLLNHRAGERRWIAYDVPFTEPALARPREFKVGWGRTNRHVGNRDDRRRRLRKAAGPRTQSDRRDDYGRRCRNHGSQKQLPELK